MMPLSHNLNLRIAEDRKELFDRLTAAGIRLDPAALQYALAILLDDWFELAAGLEVCSLKTSAKGSEAISLAVWAFVIQSVYEFRSHRSFEKVARRLAIPSHEKLDTVLVLQVARRYHKRDFDVTFEPFDKATTDLLVERRPYRLYLEIKRENPREHKRFLRIQEVTGIINSTLDGALRHWLREKGFRLEIKLSRLFSNPHAEKIADEICTDVSQRTVGTETALKSLKGSTMVLLPRDAEFYYQKGMHSGIVRVEVAGQPVQLSAPSSMPVRTTFAIDVNLAALGERIREAGKQLRRDLNRDGRAEGFIVLECMFGEKEVVEAIQKRFWKRLPAGCWGIVLISPSRWLIPRSDLTPEHMEILKYAALDPQPVTPQ